MKRLSLVKLFTAVTAIVFPAITQAVVTPTTFKGFTSIIINIIQLLMPVLVGLSLLAFIWGLSKFILASGNEEAISDGKKIMLWGLIALFFMVSVWGIVSILSGSFGFNFGVPQLGEGGAPSTTGACWDPGTCLSNGGICDLAAPGSCAGAAVCSDGPPPGC